MTGDPLLDAEPIATPATSTTRPSLPMVLTIGLVSLAAVGALAVRDSSPDRAVPGTAAAITPAETNPASSPIDTQLTTTGGPERAATPPPAAEPAAAAPVGAEPAATAPVGAEPAAADSSQELDSTNTAPIELASLDGSRLEIPSGVPTVVYFMSTTGCVACEIGAFELQDLYAEGHRLDVIALEVIPDVPAEWMADYQQQLRLDYPVVADPDGAVAARYDVAVLSIAIVVDDSGQMVAGPFDPTDRTALDAAVAAIAVQRTTPADSGETQPFQLLP